MATGPHSPESPRGAPRTRAPPATPRRPSRAELGPKHLLVELAHTRLGDLGDELEAVGEPPLGELRREVVAELVWRHRCSLLHHDAGHGSLAPSLDGDPDDRGLQHG